MTARPTESQIRRLRITGLTLALLALTGAARPALAQSDGLETRPVRSSAAEDDLEVEGGDEADSSTGGAGTRTSSAARWAALAELQFVKGDLIYVGTRELLSRYDHGGVRVGPHVLGKDLFLGVDPGFAYYPGDWAISLHLPLNLLLLETGTTDFGGLKVRRQDWDEASDFGRVIRFVSFGRRETSPLYLSITSLRPHSLGHGMLMLNYQPNIDIDRSMTGGLVEVNSRYAGAQLRVADVTFQNQVLGALAFVKPLGFMDDEIFSSLSLGVEYAGDWEAPLCVRTGEAGECVLGGPTAGRPLGHQAGPDPLTGESRDQTFIRTDPDLGRPYVDETAVHAVGFSGEMRVMKTDRSDLKLYGTFHQFLDHGNGVAGGLFGRFTTGERDVHAFRLRAEYRTFEADFAPNYFDTLYEVTKYQFSRATPRAQTTPTKYQAVFGDPDNGYALTDTDRRHGFRLEGSWAWFHDSRGNKQLGLGVGLSDSTADDDTDLYVHAELPLLRYLQLFGTLLRINADGLGDLFSGDTDNLVVLAGARLQILPILFINAHYSRSFQIIRGPGHELHLGNETIVDEAGQPSPFFASDRIFENVQTLFVELELGLELKGDD